MPEDEDAAEEPVDEDEVLAEEEAPEEDVELVACSGCGEEYHPQGISAHESSCDEVEPELIEARLHPSHEGIQAYCEENDIDWSYTVNRVYPGGTKEETVLAKSKIIVEIPRSDLEELQEDYKGWAQTAP